MEKCIHADCQSEASVLGRVMCDPCSAWDRGVPDISICPCGRAAASEPQRITLELTEDQVTAVLWAIKYCPESKYEDSQGDVSRMLNDARKAAGWTK